MKQKFYIVKESEAYIIYKVDYSLASAFEEEQRENVSIKAQDLQELILQFDRQKLEKLQLNKRVRSVLSRPEYKRCIAKQPPVKKSDRRSKPYYRLSKKW